MSIVTRFTLTQYERMVEAGVFSEEERRFELLRGEIVPMSPIGVPHWRTVNFLNRWSVDNTDAQQIEVSVQNPIGLPGSDSAPEPDIAWLRAKAYTAYARPAEVLLVIEVADTTMQKDTVLKAALYAEAKIADYWVVDLAGQVVHVHRDPRQGRYATITMARVGASLSPLCAPEANLDLAAMFGQLP